MVARYEAQQAGQAFDAELHRASIRLAQDNLLSELTAGGVIYRVTSTEAVGGSTLPLPDRYTELINAVRLEALAEDIGRIRTPD